MCALIDVAGPRGMPPAAAGPAERTAAPRRPVRRTAVPRGSVGRAADVVGRAEGRRPPWNPVGRAADVVGWAAGRRSALEFRLDYRAEVRPRSSAVPQRGFEGVERRVSDGWRFPVRPGIWLRRFLGWLGGAAWSGRLHRFGVLMRFAGISSGVLGGCLAVPPRGSGFSMAVVMLVHHRVALAAGDQPHVDRHGQDERRRQGEGE
jgi:hypothetical protein